MKTLIGRFFQRRGNYHTQESGAGLFRGLRIRLTFWYCGVLVAALVIFGVALYISTQFALLNPVQDAAQTQAQGHAHMWFDPHGQPCPLASDGFLQSPPEGRGLEAQEMVFCFDAHGQPLPNQLTNYLPTAFINNSLAKEALQSSSRDASDTVNTVDPNGKSGIVYRYALVVCSPVDNSVLGVVMVGEHIEVQQGALWTLLQLLLIIGGGALLCACLGGLFLANRALAPARLAWSNQQRFIADASHELRTPLTLMRADAEVLLRGRRHMDAEDADLLEDIVVEVNHMAKITTNLLTLARLDNQFAHREHEVIELAQLAGAIVRRVQALAGQRGISVYEEHASDTYVIGDPTLLEQAVLVLLDNAIKYNRPEGRISVRTTVQHERVVLEVQDSGIGITAEHLPYLGERFYRVDKARSRAAGGTGLGLSIARSITSTHGGQLTLTSADGQGTTVTLALPQAHHIRSALPVTSSDHSASSDTSLHS